MSKIVTLTELNSIPDIDDNGRFLLDFGVIPNVEENVTSGIGARALLIKCLNVEVPGSTSAQRRVVYPGGFWRSFSGGRDTSNSFDASFYEDVNAGTTRTLLGWKKWVSDGDNGTSKYQNEYGVPCQISKIDTAGNNSIIYVIERCWPISVKRQGLSHEGSQAGLVDVQFSFDTISYG